MSDSTPLNYHSMSLSGIAADLEETMFDLLINAGEAHLEPLVDRLESLDIGTGGKPGPELVAVMERLHEYDADLLDPRAQELMRIATEEICRLVEA